MRLVLDTNTVVSGLLLESASARLIHAALRGDIQLFTSRVLLLELEDVLPRRKLARKIAASGHTVSGLAERYALLATIVQPAGIAPISADPDDDHVLACALAANADLIVSGDQHLLNLKHYHGIQIARDVEALKRIGQG